MDNFKIACPDQINPVGSPPLPLRHMLFNCHFCTILSFTSHLSDLLFSLFATEALYYLSSTLVTCASIFILLHLITLTIIWHYEQKCKYSDSLLPVI